MGDWPNRESAWDVGRVSIGTVHPFSIGPGIIALHNFAAPLSTAWPAANRALFVPFRLPSIATAYQMIVGCGATGGGNFDAGIYDEAGNLLVSGGSTARVAAGEVVVDITDTVLGQGNYYMALSVDGTNNMTMYALATIYHGKFVGVRQATSAFVLPSTVTFETLASAPVPHFSVVLRSE